MVKDVYLDKDLVDGPRTEILNEDIEFRCALALVV